MDTKIDKDLVTDLPTLSSCLDHLILNLKKQGYLGVILIDLARLSKIERDHGSNIYNYFLKDIARVLFDMKKEILRKDDAIFIINNFSEDFLIMLSEKRGADRLQREDMETVGDKIYNYLLSAIRNLTIKFFKETPHIDIGYSFIIQNPMLDLNRVIQRMVGEAREIARSQRYRFLIKNREQLKEIILSRSISTLFQPIVNLKTGKILGYEALSRGPEGTVFENPAILFDIAIETGLAFELDVICRELSLKRAAKINDKKVFINVLPMSLNDPVFRGKYLKKFLEDVKRTPENIILELTEKIAVEEFSYLNKSLSYYRSFGFAIAIDDAGTGYANLELIIQLKPDYLKIDISLIRDIDKSILKKELVKALNSVSRVTNSKIIAEGIEKEDEALALIELDIEYGQGYYFGRPEVI